MSVRRSGGGGSIGGTWGFGGVVSTMGWPRLLKTVDVSGGLVRALKLTASAVDFANGALKSKTNR